MTALKKHVLPKLLSPDPTFIYSIRENVEML